ERWRTDYGRLFRKDTPAESSCGGFIIMHVLTLLVCTRVDTRRIQKHRGLSRPRYTPVNKTPYSHPLQSLNSGAVRWQSNLESNSERAATTLSTAPTRAKHPSSSTETTLILPAAETIMHSAGAARTHWSPALATILSSSAKAPACLSSAARRSQKA